MLFFFFANPLKCFINDDAVKPGFKTGSPFKRFQFFENFNERFLDDLFGPKLIFYHGYSHRKGQPHSETQEESELPDIKDLAAYEAEKVKGAIRTDFILSAEIIVIALGTVQGKEMMTQIIVVSLIAMVMTAGVYGLVAGIVKLDDLGFYLERKAKGEGLMAKLGGVLVAFAPKLMKGLTVVGTAAMFLVGGGIVVHNVPFIHHWVEPIIMKLPDLTLVNALVPTLLNGAIGVAAGLIVVAVMEVIHKVRGK